MIAAHTGTTTTIETNNPLMVYSGLVSFILSPFLRYLMGFLGISLPALSTIFIDSDISLITF